MATFSFPNSPSLNQTYTFQGKTWKYNGTGWALVTNVDIAQSAWNTANLAYINSNTADILAQAAYDTANTKFSSSGGTITGPTTIAANVTISGNNNLTVTGNLNVLGYTTTSYTNSLTLSNAMFSLHTSNTLGPLTTNDGLNIGMAFHYYDTADKQAILVRENSTGYLIWYNTSTNLIGNTDSKGITMGTFQTDALIANTVLANGIELYAFTTSAYNAGNNTLTYATAGFNKANAANVLAQSAYDSGNSTLTYATAGFNKANAANVLAQSSYDFANTVNTYSFSAYSYANSTNTLTVAGFNKANAANVLAQSAYDSGNSTLTYATSGFNEANAANVLAQSSYDFANTVNTYAFSAYSYANATNTLTVSAYNKANAANVLAQSAYDAGNSTNTLTVSSYNKANAANVLAQSAYDSGNNTYTYAQSGYTKANNAVQTAFVTVSANGTSITPSSNNDTLTITAATANGINVLNPSSKTIDFGLRTSGVTAGNYGSSTNIPVIAVDAFGRITSASNTSISTSISLSGTTGSGSVSGGGTLTFNSTNGVTESISGSTITINTPQDLRTSASPTFVGLTTTGDVNIAGNLSVAGTYTYSNTQVFQTVDSLIELAANNTSDVVDIGFYGQYNTNKYAGLVRTGGGNFALFKELSSPTSNTFGNITLGNYGTLRANLTGGMISGLANTIGIVDGGTNNSTYTTGALLQYNGSAIVSLANTGVSAGITYGNTTSIPSITLDAYGRVTSISNNAIYVPPGTSIVANTGQLTANAATGIVALGLATTAVSAGNYGGSTQIPVLAIDAYGRITSASNTSVSTTISLAAGSGSGSVSGGGTLTVSGGTGITTSASGSTITITNSGVTSLTSNSTGRITQSSTTGAVTFDLATTSVTAATYNYSTIQVDAYGRITSASSGTPVTTFNTRSGAVTLSSSDVTTALTYTPANIAGDTFTGAVTVPSLKANTSVTVNTSGFITSTSYTTSSTSQVTVDSFATATYRSAKYLAQMTSGTSYHVIELRVVHDGTNPLLAQYGEIFTGSSLGTFDVSITTGNLNLLFTPTNSATTVKLIRTNIVV